MREVSHSPACTPPSDSGTPCSVLTKSPLLLRDVDLFRELGDATSFTACLSIPTLDEAAWRATEPHTPNPKARLEAVRKLDLDALPDDLHELAALRMRHPTASIADLAKKCHPPTTKASAYRRLRRLQQLAE